jgi:hypothetical protein
MKIIEDKFFRPENCDKLCVPKDNKEIWSALPRPAHTQDSIRPKNRTSSVR